MNDEQRSNISGGQGDIFELKGQDAGLVDQGHPTRTDLELTREGSEERSSERVLADNDSAKTPRGEGPPASVDWPVEAALAAGTTMGSTMDIKAGTGPAPAGAMSSTVDRHAEGPGIDRLIPPASAPEYFRAQGNEVPETFSRPDTVSTNSTLSSPLHSAGPSSSSLQSSTIPGLPHSISADSTELFSRLIRVQSNLSAQSSRSRGTAGRHSSRHSRQEPSVSSPLSLSLSFSKPRSANEGPNYPDQSFAALQRQPYTPPYSYFRTHSPFVYQGSPHDSSPNQSEEFLLSPANRTGGSTPVDSPVLFSTSVRRGRVMEDEMVSSQYQAPALHPTHHTAPKESHSLRKDYDAISGHKLINEYEILSEIGQGTHGKVKLARKLNQENDGNFVAIKIVKRFRQKSLRLGGRETQEDKVKKEIAVLKKARHSHVVSLIEVIDDPQSDKVYMVLEYVEEGEMKWRRKADKWTVDFERRRVEQEMLAWQHGEQVDLHREGVEIEDFNSRAEWRVHEKARQLASQKQRAFEAISSRRSSSGTVFTDDELGSHDVEGGWSLEHGGESDTDLPEIPVSRRMSRMTLNSPGAEETARRLGPYGFPAAAKSTDGIFRDPWVSGSDPGSPALSTVGAHLINTHFPESVEKDQNFQRELKMIRKLDDANTFVEEDEHYRHVPCLTTARARECFRDTVLGLEYLHYQGIIHRDIKPANLLWDRNHRVKISDFGVSYLGRGDEEDANPNVEVRDDDIELAKTVGTPAFYAPELCDPDLFSEGNEKRRNIGTPMDIWALGVTLYCMIFARLPFAHSNQIKLFELIAKQELFIPSKRLRAVRLNKRETPEPRDRPDDVLQYEEIGDELTDLLKRMLHKDPRQRITIREIKRHPWVVKGMLDPLAWIDKTDPAAYGKGRKINVTAEDVHAAIAPLTFVEKLRNFKQRMSSLVRGRNPSKHPESRSGQSGSASSRSVDPARKDGRRASLRGEDIYSALRSRTEASSAGEHPLSRSQLASPSQEQPENYFVLPRHETASGSSAGTPAQQQRPTQPDRGPSTAESIKTIRPRRSSRSDFMKYPPWYDGPADEPSLGSFEDTPTSHPASITQRFGGTSRTNFSVSSKRSNVSMSSSNSTSSDRISSNYEDPHTLPLVGVSAAVAKGRVQSPLIPQFEHAPTLSPQIGRSRARAVTAAPRLSSSNEAFAQAQLQNIRREHNDIVLEQASARRARSRPHSRSASDCPLSPDDEIFLARQRHLPSFSTTASSLSRPSSASQHGFSAISSCDDVRAEATFSDNSRHPSMPSVVSASSATSASGSVDEHVLPHAEKHNPEMRLSREALMSTGETVTPAAARGLYAMMQTASSGEEKIMQGVQEPADNVDKNNVREDDDENGYNGDHDADEDSDDEGIVFGDFHR